MPTPDQYIIITVSSSLYYRKFRRGKSGCWEENTCYETSVREQLIMKRLTFTRVFAILTVLHLPYAIQASSFTIDYEKNTFLKDGEAFRWAAYLTSELWGSLLNPRTYWLWPEGSGVQTSCGN